LTLVNGKAGGRQISTADRGFLYGQTVFETIVVSNSQPHLLQPHLERLKRGCSALAIPYPERELLNDIQLLLRSPEVSLAKAVIRVTISMGEGTGRGYQNPESPVATRIVSLHNHPSYPSRYYQRGVECGLADIRLAAQPMLAGLKHGNRLEQIIARSQWQAHWQEALLLDQHDAVIEATHSNIFVVNGQTIQTPSLDQAGVEGVMREFILQNAQLVGADAEIVSLSVADIEQADAVFLSNSIIGLWPVKQFCNTTYSDFSFAHKLLNIMKENGAIPNS